MQLALFLAYPSMNAVHECVSMSFCFDVYLNLVMREDSYPNWDGMVFWDLACRCGRSFGHSESILLPLRSAWKHMETWSSILVKKMFHHTSLGHLVSNFTDARKSLSGPPSDMYFRWKIHHRPPPSVAYRTCTSSVEKEKDPPVHWICQFALKRVEIWYICIFNQFLIIYRNIYQ